MEAVPITTDVVESRSRRGVKYVIKFVRDLRQVGGLLRVLRFPSPIKLTATMLKVALSTINEQTKQTEDLVKNT
jgi:hypothetical protein